MKLSEMKGEVRTTNCEYIERRWVQLHESINERIEGCWKYLMVTNSGSAIALLGFMGSRQTMHPMPGATLMLKLFLIGVVLVGIAHAISYYRINNLFRRWREDVSSFYGDQIDWDKLLADDNKRSGYFIWVDIVGWLSFFCFLVGLSIGIFNIN